MKLDFDYAGGKYLGFSEEAAEGIGVPAEVIAAAKLDVRRRAVSAECRRRIYAVASAEAQMNVATAVSLASSKDIAARTADDLSLLADAEAWAGWVAAMRATVATLSDGAGADFTADSAWPVVPAEALELIQRF